MNRDPSALLPQGKYDVARALPEAVQTVQIVLPEQRQLSQAA